MQEQMILLRALKIDDRQARSQFLDAVCGKGTELRRRIESLLSSESSRTNLLDAVDFEQTVTPDQGSTVDRDKPSTPEDCTTIMDAGRSDRMQNTEAGWLTGISIDFLLPSTNPEMLGRLGHYDIAQVLGKGAFGIVLKAFDQKLERIVAIKVLSPVLAQSAESRRRFLREARMSAAVRHQHVVRIYAVEEQPTPYLVMEYIPGQTIKQRVEEYGPFELTEILRLGQQIASGLAAAHGIGLIHRDIKPANILLEQAQPVQAKITDFGLARGTDDSNSTQSGSISGTPMYMSPEQAQGSQIDQRSDLFSLGSVLYLMASGQPPFPASSTIAVLRRVVEDTPRPIREVVATVPDWLCLLIARLHAKDPQQRFDSATDVAEALGQGLAEVERGTNTQPPNKTSLVASKSLFHRSGDRIIAAAAIVVAVPILLYLMNFYYERPETSPIRKSSQAIAAPQAMQASPPPLTEPLALETPLEMLPRLTPASMADGRYEDVSVRDNVLTIDATGQSPNVWINFFDLAGEELTLKAEIRVLTPERSGFAKLSFMPHGQSEYFVLIGNIAGKQHAWIDSGDARRRGEKGTPVPQILNNEPIEVAFIVLRDQYTFTINHKPVLTAPREQPVRGSVALGAGGWRYEISNPRVVIHRK